MALATVLLCGTAGRAAGETPPPAPLTQPDLGAERTLTAQTDLVRFDLDGPGWIVTERLTVNWSFAPFFAVSATLPVGYTSFESGSDPVDTHSGAVVGNPTLLARGRARFEVKGWSITPSIATGVIIPTRGEITVENFQESDSVRLGAMYAHLVHRPYDFSYGDPVIPVVASVSLTRDTTTVQVTAVVNTDVEGGDPQVDMLQGTGGIAWRAEPVVLLADVGILAIPPGPQLLGGEPPDAESLPWVEVGIGWQVRSVDLRARVYVPADLPPERGDVDAAGVGLDAIQKF